MQKKLLFFWIVTSSPLAAMAQGADTVDLKERFIQYQLHSMQEKIFVHTDKTFYLSGEIIWFKLYTVDESFHKPAGISTLAYVEIISSDQKAVMQAKISLREGKGDGSFMVPSSVASGNYILRSYTSRMRNFSADYYFEQPISIVNTLKEPMAKSAEAKTRYQLDFFPEGGNMVNGLEATVGFKITDQYGTGIDASGYLINNNNDTLKFLQTLRFGMGSFAMLPQKGMAFRAVFSINDTSIVQNLPQAYDQGYTMHCSDDAGSDMLKVTVNSSSQFNQLPVYLFVHTRHLVKQVLAEKLVNGKAVFTFAKSKLGEGVSHITVFNEARQPVCERLYFKRPVQKLVIAAKTDRDSYDNRNKISVALQTSNQTGQPLSADMSVAVFMIDSLQPLQYQDIQAWMLLQSELRGTIASPQFYFTDSSATATAALNNLLLTKGWRRFKWEDILTNKPPAFEFITEQEGPVINAVLTDKTTGLPQKNILTTITVPGEKFEFRSALSRQDGSIRFNVNDFYSSNEIVLQPVNAADSNIKINMVPAFSDKFSSTGLPKFSLNAKWKDLFINRSINAQADNAYLIDKKTLSFSLPAVDTNVFYGKPDKQYYLDDYTRFITMEEVMKEFVAEVRVRKQADGFQFRVVNGAFKEFFEQDPLVLMDGLPVSNMNKIMAFDPLKVKKIEVATHKHFLGPLVSEGVVSYTTYQGDLAGFELDPHSVVIEYEGLQRQRIFYSPVYETNAQKESRLPDLRNVLYWSPDIATGPDGRQQFSFYTSDINASFAVVVQGLTAQGLCGSSVSNFTVRGR